MDRQQSTALAESLDAAFRFLRWAAIAAVIAVLGSGIRFIQSDQAALVLRFGKLVGATRAEQVHGPGILFAWPYLIDTVVRVPVKKVQEVHITRHNGEKFERFESERGDRSVVEENTLDPREVGYFVTSDSNIVHADVLVKYQIKDPVNYALYLEDPDEIITSVVTEAMMGTIGRTKVDFVLAEGKRKLISEIMMRVQDRLDQLDTGITLVAFEFQEIKPSKAVAPDFQDVVNAYVEKETKVRKAEKYRQEEVPNARGERESMIAEAKGDAEERLAKARGEATAFKELLAEYQNNRQVVRERLYRETVEKVIDQVGVRTLVPYHASGPTQLLLPAKPSAVPEEEKAEPQIAPPPG